MEGVIIKRSLNVKLKVGVRHDTWDISVTGDIKDEDAILEQIDDIHRKLTLKYGKGK